MQNGSASRFATALGGPFTNRDQVLQPIEVQEIIQAISDL
jgi:hypothetical protein